MTKLHERDGEGIRFSSERRGDVSIPYHVIDLWQPLLGARTIGVYISYCRLGDNDDSEFKISMAELESKTRVSVAELHEINAMLLDCGFIHVTATKAGEAEHGGCTITLLEPPTAISANLIAKYASPDGYKPLSAA